MKTKKLVCTAMFVAVSVVGGSFFSFPLGVAKVAPVQHLINLLSGVLLGPWYAVLQAFTTSLLRNLLGTGTVLAFPGSMIGALFTGLLYHKTKKLWIAASGEIIGTGIIGALCAYLVAWIVFPSPGYIWVITLSFIGSAGFGAVVGYVLLNLMRKQISPLQKLLN